MSKKLIKNIIPEGTRLRSILHKLNRLIHRINIKNIKTFWHYITKFGIKGAFKKVYTVYTETSSEEIYQIWIENNEPDSNELELQKKHIFDYSPKISILVPMYKTPITFFQELLNSVVNQTYSNWELCLADGSPEKNEEIENLIKHDNRIKYKFLNKNMGISENTNEALKLSSGDFIGFLDHDDTLTPFALFEIVKCINENPDVQFIYSDEDNISENSDKRIPGNFKPDFSINTLLSKNYICHFSVFKKDLMDKLGGLRSKYDGSQDHDLVLRMTELTDKIIHIPKVLYHWRSFDTSFSRAQANLSKTDSSGVAAVQDYLNRLGISATVSYGKHPHFYDVFYDVIGNPKVSIIIPNKDQYSILKTCIDSILNLTTYKNYEIIIVENNSTTKKIFNYYDELKKEKNVKVLYYKEKIFNYSKLINFGIKNCSGEYIVQLNNDTKLLTPNWLERMLGFAQRENVGIVGVKLYFPDMSIQHAGVIFGEFGITHSFRLNYTSYFGDDCAIRDVSAVTGACMMASRKIYEQVRIHG